MMMAILKKLNWVHLGLILALPIILALINPNWIFSSGVDSFFYLGYQNGLPKYLNWSPANQSYFIDRINWILPGYIIRQLFSPLLANFIIHLSVYYATMFSVYTLIYKFTNTRTALITVLLLGQYPIIMRSVGWDYPNGYANVWFLLSVLCLTYATTSPRRLIYLFGAGMTCMMMITAHFFYIFYSPALAVYFMLLDNWEYKKFPIIKTGLCVLLGILFAFVIQATVFYLITGNILLTNSLNVAQTTTTQLDYSVSIYQEVSPHWLLFLVLVVFWVVWIFLRWRSNGLSRKLYDALRAYIGLFLFSYLIMVIWWFLGFEFGRVSFYQNTIITILFILIGLVFGEYINKKSHKTFYMIAMLSFIIPITPLFGFTFGLWILPERDMLLYAFIAVFFWMASIRLVSNINVISLIISISIMNMLLANVIYVDVYVPNRYAYQTQYEIISDIIDIIELRYSDYSMESFRFWYSALDPQLPLFFTLDHVYLSYWWLSADGRRSFFNLDTLMPDDVIFSQDQTTEIIFLTSQSGFPQYLHTCKHYDITILDIYTINSFDISISLIPLTVTNLNMSKDKIIYKFSPLMQSFVLFEQGWHGYEQINDINFRWMAEDTAKLILDISDCAFDSSSNYVLDITTVSVLEPELLDTFSLQLNGASIVLSRFSENRFEAIISGDLLRSPQLEVLFEIERTTNPFDLGIQDGRKLGVAIGELIIERVIESD